MLTDLDEAAAAVRATFTDAVACRVDTDLRVGVVPSGGLDSSLTLLQVHALHSEKPAVETKVASDDASKRQSDRCRISG